MPFPGAVPKQRFFFICPIVQSFSYYFAGDVETNPGPLTEAQEQLMLQSLAILPQLEAGQVALLN